MKRKINIVLVIFIFNIYYLNAQTYIFYGDKAFGTDQNDFYPSIVKTDSGSFVLAGSTIGGINGDKTVPNCDTILPNGFDIWILKIDTSFNIKWDKKLGGLSDEDQPNLFINKNEIILSCTSYSDSSCEKNSNNKSYPIHFLDYWIVTLDTSGNIIRQNSYGGIKDDYSVQSIVLSSGNIINCGNSASPISGDKTVLNFDSVYSLSGDYWVVKTDTIGNKIWDNVYGGNSKEFANNTNGNFNMFNIITDEHDNFTLAGTTQSPISGSISDSSRGLKDIWLIKIDSLGGKIWDKRYGGANDDKCNHIIHSTDNGYVLCGETDSPQGLDVSDSSQGATDFWVIKLDSVGNKIWDKRYGGNKNDRATWIEKAPGGGYWISGSSESDMGGDVSEPKYAPTILADYWIIKIDEYGNKLWDKRFGGPNGSVGSSFIIMPDSSIFLAGSSIAGINVVKTDSGRSKNDYWVVHFKYTDSIYLSGVTELSSFSNNVSVFPNPTKDYVTIKSQAEKIKSVELINVLGEKIYTQQITNLYSTKLNLQAFPSGFYFVKITGEKNSVIKKVLKQ